MAAGAVPNQLVAGVNVIIPVVVLTLYVPPVTESVVAVQFGGV